MGWMDEEREEAVHVGGTYLMVIVHEEMFQMLSEGN